jgi:hypothetical protein
MRVLSRAILMALIAAGVEATLMAQARLPRTPDGRPDLQGVWLNNTATPLERPREFAGRLTISDEEARAYEQRYQLERTSALAATIGQVDPAVELAIAGDIDTYEPGQLLPGNRTAMVIDPADGRVPPMLPDAQQRQTDRTAHNQTHYGDNPEDFPNSERCLVVGNASVPPMLPAFYNNHVQIVQTRDAVMILSEMVHDVRVVALNRREHLPPSIQQWKGDSIGRWDGDTLVVDTTNFTDKTRYRGTGPALHIVERLSLSDANTLTYEFTIEDPATFARPWTARSGMSRTDEPLYEFACHEGNYSLPNVLRGARFTERTP